MEHPDSHCVEKFHIRISVIFFSVFGVTVNLYGQLPIIFGNFGRYVTGRYVICNSGKLHLKTFFKECAQKVFKHSKLK